MKVFIKRIPVLASRTLFALLFVLISFHSLPAHASDAALGVTQIEALQTNAISDGTFADGWKWVFNVTVPSDQTALQMKFQDWTNGTNTFPVIGNTRFFSTQALDATSESTAYTINASNAYSTSTTMHLDPSADLDSSAAGRQIQITVETAIPTGTPNGSYSTNYGINTFAPSAPSTTTQTTVGTLKIIASPVNRTTSIVAASPTQITKNVTLNDFYLTASSSPITLNSLPVSITTSLQISPHNLIQDLKLYNGSTLLETESPPTSTSTLATVTFTNLHLVIPAGTTDHLAIRADISPIDGVTVYEGATATLSINNTGVTAVDENSNPVPVTGSSLGNLNIFRTSGISIATLPTSATATATLSSGNSTQQTGTFTFVFNVTAVDQTLYVGSASSSYSFTLIDQTSYVATTSGITSGITSSANRSPDGNFMINSGQTVSFTITATRTGGSNHFYYGILNDLKYGTNDNTPLSTEVDFPSTYATNSVLISS
jgi:hypothetical protein